MPIHIEIRTRDIEKFIKFIKKCFEWANWSNWDVETEGEGFNKTIILGGLLETKTQGKKVLSVLKEFLPDGDKDPRPFSVFISPFIDFQKDLDSLLPTLEKYLKEKTE